MTKDIGLGQPMPDDPTDPDNSHLEGISDADLARALGDEVPVTSSEQPPPADPPDDSPPAGVERLEEVAPAVQDEKPPDPSPQEPPPEPEPDPVEERMRLERERHEASLELQRQHASRMAGEIGHLKNLLRQQSQSRPESYGSDAQDGDDGSGLRDRLEQLESRLQAEARDRVIAEEMALFHGRPDLAGIPETTWKSVGEKYGNEWTQALDTSDPELARRSVRAVLSLVVAEAKEAEWGRRQQEAKLKQADQAARLRAGKVAAGSTVSSQAPEQKRKPKSVNELSDAELDRLIDNKIASG